MPQRGDPATLESQLVALEVSPRRLDLGAAHRARGRGARLRRATRARSCSSAISRRRAVSPARARRPAARGASRHSAAAQRRHRAAWTTGAQPWSGEGGRVALTLAGDSGLAVALTARLGDRPPRQALGRAGSSVTLALPGVPSGWWTLSAELAPDELRADDQRTGVVRVAPVARVAWDTAARHVAAACEVLAANRRIARGDEVTFGRLGRGQLGGAAARRPRGAGRAQSRARRARRGLELRRASRSSRRPPTAARSWGRVRVARRYLLQSTGSGRTGVLATVAGPAVDRAERRCRSARQPARAGVDRAAARGGIHALHGSAAQPARPGRSGHRPGRAGRSAAAARSRHRRAAGRARVAGGGRRLLPSGGRRAPTTSSPDATRSARSAPTSTRGSRCWPPRRTIAIRELWKGARVTSLESTADLVFAAGALADFRGPLLAAALLLGLCEVGLASLWRRQR